MIFPICSVLSLGLTITDVYWGPQIYNWMDNNFHHHYNSYVNHYGNQIQRPGFGRGR